MSYFLNIYRNAIKLKYQLMLPFVGTFFIFSLSAFFLHNNLVKTQEYIDLSVSSNNFGKDVRTIKDIFSNLRLVSLVSEKSSPDKAMNQLKINSVNVLEQKDKIFNELRSRAGLSQQVIDELRIIEQNIGRFYSLSEDMAEKRIEKSLIFDHVLPYFYSYFNEMNDFYKNNNSKWNEVRVKLLEISERIAYRSSDYYYLSTTKEGDSVLEFINDMEKVLLLVGDSPVINKTRKEFIQVWRKELAALNKIVEEIHVLQKERGKVRLETSNLLDSFIESSEKVVNTNFYKTTESAKSSIIVNMLGLTGGVLIASILVTILTRIIITQLNSVQSVIRGLAERNLVFHTNLKGENEVSQLGENTDITINTLRGTIKDLNSHGQELASASLQLRSVMEL
ncbi:methyl-accepting chemotaxis protein, partial [Aliivibrio fischeri]